MSTNEPDRLLESESEAQSLRVDLGRAKADVVDYDVVAGVAAFELAVADLPPGGGPEAGGGEAAAPAAATGTAKTAMIAVAVAAVAGAAAIGLSGRSDERPAAVAEVRAQESAPLPAVEHPAQRAAVEAKRPEEAAAVQVPSAGEDASTGVPADEYETATETASATAERPSRSNPKPRKPDKKPEAHADRLRAEMLATDRAGKALASDPARALSLARQADRDYADGLFTEQRAGVKALALFALGKDTPARSAAERYLRKYPKGTYADKVRKELDEKP